MNYRNVSQLNSAIIAWLPKLPRDLDIIVGIPRSGLLVANLLALYMHVDFTDVEGFLEGRIINSGKRLYTENNHLIDTKFDGAKVMVIDDSLNSGNQMSQIRNQIRRKNNSSEILYGVVYITPGNEEHVDYYFESVPNPRVFQWNIINSWVMERSCVDIDGVLCVDPTEDENDDSENHLNFIKTAKPLWIPKVKIPTLVTCRLEKYRSETVDWLEKYDIDYDKLIMMNLPDIQSRKDYGHSKFKAEVFLGSKQKYFIESSKRQASEIAKLSRKSVFCVETMEFIDYKEPQLIIFTKSILRNLLPNKTYQTMAINYRKIRKISRKKEIF